MIRLVIISFLLLLLMNGCGFSRSTAEKSPHIHSTANSHGYYQDDGPPLIKQLVASEDAILVRQPLSKRGNNPYVVRGIKYYPDVSVKRFEEQGEASWYGKKFHGRRTSSGDIYDMFQMTAAHKTLPLPSYVRVTNVKNQISVIVKVNDRGPFLKGRVIDLSYAAAKKIGIVKSGVGQVNIQLILPPSPPV